MSLLNSTADYLLPTRLSPVPSGRLGRQDITDYLNSLLLLSPHPARPPLPPAPEMAVEAREMIAWLKNEGLPVSAIADALQVERKSIYNWLDGGKIKDHNYERLNTIYRLLSETHQAGLRHLYRLFGRALSGGGTLAGLLAAERLDEAELRDALAQLWPVARGYEETEARRPARTGIAGNPVLSEIPEAIARDDR